LRRTPRISGQCGGRMAAHSATLRLARVSAKDRKPPFLASAAEPAHAGLPVVGVLLYRTKLPNQEHPLIAGLRDVGLVDGRTASIPVREAEGRTERLPQLAGELVAAKPDVIVTAGPQPIKAVKDATSTIPIVMAILSDPITYGFVQSLPHPGGNLTRLSMINTELRQQAHRITAGDCARYCARRGIHRPDDGSAGPARNRCRRSHPRHRSPDPAADGERDRAGFRRSQARPPPPQMITRITAPAVRLSLPANWLDGSSAVEPGILHAPLVVGAVDPDGDPLDLRI